MSTIYYSIEDTQSYTWLRYALFSVVFSSFGSNPARNLVRMFETHEEAEAFAKGMGWSKYQE